MNCGNRFFNGCKRSNFTVTRKWEKIDNKTSVEIHENEQVTNFCVLSYNILSQELLERHRYLYFRCRNRNLTWTNRLPRIENERKLIDPDIICFQELEDAHLEQITKYLEEDGYKLVYKKRTGKKPDGCGICYKTDVFDLIEQNAVELCVPNLKKLNYDNIGLMVKLTSKRLDAPFVVCTTHLLFNPKRDDVRLAQMQMILADLDKFSYHKSKEFSYHIPIIITGDFNSSVDSYVTTLMNTGHVDLSEIDHISLQSLKVTNTCQHLQTLNERNTAINDRPRFLFDNSRVIQNFGFKSVYNHKKPSGACEATTHHSKWLVVDYIYYASSQGTELSLKERYYLPTIAECKRMGALPNSQFGSDHISLAAKFQLSKL